MLVHVSRATWLVILVSSLAAFIYTSADCLLDYVTSLDNGHHGDQRQSDVIAAAALPAFTVCNLNPLRSPHLTLTLFHTN